MPIVFVHGVAVRQDADYPQAVAARNALFQSFAIPGGTSQPIRNPFWGDKGANFLWNEAYLPKQGVGALGASVNPSELLVQQSVGASPDPINPLLTLARASFPNAVDLLISVTARQTAIITDQNTKVASFAVDAAEYARAFPAPSWLSQVHSDAEFIQRLNMEIQQRKAAAAPAALGFGDILTALQQGAAAIKNAAVSAINHAAVGAFRSHAQHQISTFVGDIFVYLAKREKDGAQSDILATVLAAIDAAAAERTETDPLVLVGHSMGGDILYDILASYRTDLAVDAFVTVGSQVGLFQELNVFEKKVPDPFPAGHPLMPKPDNVKVWLNVFDYSDPLGYSISSIYSPVAEFSFDTNATFLDAHGSYFLRPSFYARLHDRLKGLLA